MSTQRCLRLHLLLDERAKLELAFSLLTDAGRDLLTGIAALPREVAQEPCTRRLNNTSHSLAKARRLIDDVVRGVHDRWETKNAKEADHNGIPKPEAMAEPTAGTTAGN